ncbi:MAG: secretion system protein [Methanosarcinales archaeon]|nr:MAG: secretion system protein [Methanosarcinales archaeon]
MGLRDKAGEANDKSVPIVAPGRGLRAAAGRTRSGVRDRLKPEKPELPVDTETLDEYEAEALLAGPMPAGNAEPEVLKPAPTIALPTLSADQLSGVFGLGTGAEGAEIEEKVEEHKLRILSAVHELGKPGVEGGTTDSAFDKFIKQFYQRLRLFMMVPFVVFGDRIKAHSEKYQNLHIKLQQARMPISYEMYISNSIFYSVTAGIIGALIGLIFSFIIITVIGLPEQITKLTFSESTAWLLDYKWLFLSLFIIVFLSVVLGGIVYVLFLLYPSFKAGERKTSINQNLPYAVTFMYALSNGGMNIIEIFKSLAKCENTYGEVAKEVDMIVRDMEYFGHDLRIALQNASEMTVSSKFQDLTHNLLSVIDSGGDIPRYFKEKSDQYLKDAIIDQKGYLETLALIAESYVTAFVAGPLFIIIMGVMMVLMGSGNDMMLYAIIYAVIPIGSVMFVVMINMLSPAAGGVPALLATRINLDRNVVMPPELASLKLNKNSANSPETNRLEALKQRWARFIKSRKTLALKQVLRNPLKSVKMQPKNILLVSVPLALLFFVIAFLIHQNELLDLDLIINFLDDHLVYSFYIAIIPLAIFHEAKSMRESKLQKQIPSFLSKLASTNETGMTMRDSIKLMSKSDIGTLSKQIKLIWKDINWGMDVNDSLVRFANRIRTHVVSRSITLITRANESSGDLGEVLEVAARDADTEQTLKRERVMNMMIYIIIIYISFLVFVGVIYVISATFLTQMAEAGEQMAESGGDAGFLGAFDLNAYKRMFFHASLLQGLCSGLIAGVMGEGSVLSGLKHSIIMVTVSLLVFKLMVGGV